MNTTSSQTKSTQYHVIYNGNQPKKSSLNVTEKKFQEMRIKGMQQIHKSSNLLIRRWSSFEILKTDHECMVWDVETGIKITKK